MKPSHKRLLFRLAIPLAALLLAVMISEASYRVYVYGWGGLSPSLMNSVLTLTRSEILQETDDPELRFELKPSHRRLYKMVMHETNAHGMRDREFETSKPEGVRRIAFVGDSFTMGHGVERDEMFLKVLERRLNQADGPWRYECLNFGVAAYGLSEYVGVVRNKVPAFEPDLVIIALTANDKFPPSPSFTISNPPNEPFLQMHSWFALHLALHEAFPDWLAKPTGDRPRAIVGNQSASGTPVGPDDRAPLLVFDKPPQEWPDTLDAETMEYVRASFRELAALAETQGVPQLAVHLTQNHVGSPRGTINSQAFRKAAAEAGVPYFDTNAYLRGRALHDNIIFRNDTHPNPEVHGIYADALYDFLEVSHWPER